MFVLDKDVSPVCAKLIQTWLEHAKLLQIKMISIWKNITNHCLRCIYLWNHHITKILYNGCLKIHSSHPHGTQHDITISRYWRWIYSGLILGLRLANERRLYKVTPSLIGWGNPRISPDIYPQNINDKCIHSWTLYRVLHWWYFAIPFVVTIYVLHIPDVLFKMTLPLDFSRMASARVFGSVS